ncbi:hypothetical protein [Leptospira noguchii]|uniref:hypothetical protein n=1 Tax=Leptospira noguchii TaxID=28182 RepID=UPI001FB64286|nr:hypothetical protein [Leptospira noguchii]UOG60137.1 hypothetical protein MAL07_15630 [Leptospira noguchii]
MFLEHKAVPSMIFLNRRSQEGRWQIDRSLNSAQSFPMGRSAGLGPRSVDESKSAAANSYVATKPKSTAKGTQHLTSHGAFDGSLGIRT